ncbi:hypothetical protein [Pseudomonas alabamensis]|uniref:hypothetical protein n=1 Tax=Pseudomonas alabamensis TaxID=3064349 RepID=UPI003F64E08A
MQTATSRAFAQGAPKLEALLARTSLARQEAKARVKVTAPLYQARSKGKEWEIIEIATGKSLGIAFKHETAQVFVNAMEAAARSKLVGRQ